jgi:membrane-associated phospholipid phosphatase
MKRSPLRAPDLVIIAYESIVAALVLIFWAKLDRPALYLGMNLGLIGVTIVLAMLEVRRPTKLTTFLHAWWPVLAVPLSFKEIAWLVPGIQPFADGAWDLKLQALDEWCFGDTGAFFRSIAWGPAADLLSIGYWSYFFQPVVLGAALYRPGDLRRFREATTVLLVGWFISYLGYYAVPAVGPHLVVDGPRAPELEGWLCAGPLHRLLLALEGTIPDAFPSGHALVSMLVLVLSWRLHRRVFWWLLPFAAGLILATMYLRYHYIVDVLASVLLLPGCVALGRAIHRWRDPETVETENPVWQNPDPSHYKERS